MKIFERQKEFCIDCKFSFVREKQLFCAKTIGITKPNNNCEQYEIKNKKKIK